jgi:ADP-ribosyl-[dinitrogen reductase] hydrolase
MTELSSVQLDRAAGVLLGQACGDALGVPYEFKPPMPRRARAAMTGSHAFGPAEWSDDTELAVIIASVVAKCTRPLGADAYDEIARRFLDWGTGENGPAWTRDLGNQIGSVLHAAGRLRGTAAERCWQAARDYTERRLPTGGKAAGNGALMRTGVLALVDLFDRDATAAVVRRVAALTHVDDNVEDSCVLWTEAVRSAVLKDWSAEEGFEPAFLLAGLDLIPAGRRAKWKGIVNEATGAEPWSFGRNGWTVTTLKAAWGAITSTPVLAAEAKGGSSSRGHLEGALDMAVHAGWDTDTVAAVAGQLLGARWGASAVPQKWVSEVRGRGPGTESTRYEELRGADLVRLAVLTAGGASRK